MSAPELVRLAVVTARHEGSVDTGRAREREDGSGEKDSGGETCDDRHDDYLITTVREEKSVLSCLLISENEGWRGKKREEKR